MRVVTVNCEPINGKKIYGNIKGHHNYNIFKIRLRSCTNVFLDFQSNQTSAGSRKKTYILKPKIKGITMCCLFVFFLCKKYVFVFRPHLHWPSHLIAVIRLVIRIYIYMNIIYVYKYIYYIYGYIYELVISIDRLHSHIFVLFRAIAKGATWS